MKTKHDIAEFRKMMVSAEGRMNHRQQEFADELFQTVKAQYPEIEFISYALNPDDKQHVWIWIEAPMSEEREMELMSFISPREGEIFMEYGYDFSIMTYNTLVDIPLYGSLEAA
ncbi:MAG: hypothetical protein EAZ92_04985 [Candidatus Kapaibacterium sp.]|nr:MAG: hypothetical protein EAZ92_04985 [Candidatus Kapabacteria bacterium]